MKLRKLLPRIGLAALLLSTLNYQLPTAFAQGAAFTYQGVLHDAGSPANGVYDLRFAVYDAASGGLSAGTNFINDVGVTNGLFTVTLNFGSMAFIGFNEWLEMGVRPGVSVGAYTNLNPRTPLTPTPYAIFAGGVNASSLIGQVTDANLSATLSSPHAFTHPGSSFTGNGSGLTGLNASSLTSGTVPDARMSANVALRSGGNTFSGDQIVSSGNVGLGTTNPAQKLTVAGNALLTGDSNRTVSIAMQPDNTTAGASLTIQAGSASSSGIPFQARPGGDLILQAGNGYNASLPDMDGGDLILRSGANWISASDNGGDIVLQTGAANNTFVERVRVLENGNVGIGVTNPSTALQVNGTVTATGFSGNGSGLTNVVKITNSVFVTPFMFNTGFMSGGAALGSGPSGAPCVTFPDGATSDAQFTVTLPDNFNFATHQIKVYYTATTTSGNFDCSLFSRGTAPGAIMSSSVGGGAFTVGITSQATAATLGVGITDGVGQMDGGSRVVFFQFRRRGASAGDTSTGVLQVYGISIQWTSN